MSKLIYVCLRNPKNDFSVRIKERVELISNRLLPDNFTPSRVKVLEDDGIIIGIFNPTDFLNIKNSSVCLGSMVETEAWHLPTQARPDGTYALFRGDSDYIDVSTDVVASRTVWYFFDDSIFVASTSQRAVISLLGNFELNEEIIPWVLSTGSLGPIHAWDKQVKRLDGDSSVRLDRRLWALTATTNDVTFSPSKVSDQEHYTFLKQTLEAAFKTIQLDFSRWILPLSGGFDSRSILCLLENKNKLKTVTWGLKTSLYEKTNDAYVAKELAEHFNLPHRYYETDVVDEAIENIFNRFLVCGEGRIDHIAGYMDGFEIWKALFDDGVQGIIRGDQSSSSIPVSSPLDIRLTLGFPLWSDFSNLEKSEKFGFSKQEIPTFFLQGEEESLATWRDRLYQQFRIPVVLAALNDLKLPYVEIVNPLLTREIVYAVRSLPDHLRTDKKVFKSIVRSLSPDIDFAKHPAVATPKNILKSKRVVDFLKRELSSTSTDSVLPRQFINYVLDQVTVDGDQQSSGRLKLKDMISSRLPKRLRNKLRNTVVKPRMDFNVLAFRTYVVYKMNKMLLEDVEAMGSLFDT